MQTFVQKLRNLRPLIKKEQPEFIAKGQKVLDERGIEPRTTPTLKHHTEYNC